MIRLLSSPRSDGAGEHAGSPASYVSRPELGGGRLVEVVLVSDAGKIRRNAGAAAA
jgi:hypothetical protein